MASFAPSTTDGVEGDDRPVSSPFARPTGTARSLEQERDFLLDKVQPMRPFAMQILDVPGLVLCEDIVSDLDLPLVTTARVDGYGVRGSDLVGATPERPASLYLIDTIRAADDPGRPVVAGAAVQVEAGAIVPEGVDAVVPLSAGRLGEDDVVLIEGETRLFQNLRRAGSELADGTPLLHAGDVLTPRSVAVLAEVGLDKVMVRPRPRVVVFTVGETLIEPGHALTAPQQRYDATTALITAAARADGATVYPLGVVPADAEAVRRVVNDQQIRADLIVAIGGGSFVNDITGARDVDEALVGLNGSAPIVHAGLGDGRTPLITLPSGVVSSYVAYLALVRPLVNKLNEVDPLAGERLPGRLTGPVESELGVTHYVPAVRDASGEVTAIAASDSQLAWDLARANVLAIIPADWDGAVAGSEVECVVLGDGSDHEAR
ncbi:hypothetical protein G7070_04500 [Propioniciclava coleopterorum]|uniref:Molybdopterin molybdenumtransferase n=1 Tax=Propioniciclava coleopterorum TaxID=2714937 RepID=A0A6G7Y4F1_9ACTN|nr:gephyrin-like molybdotransferase Glp [Propioniciclava coleopterorum]QIK71663.1 hypothetical protein G7070_04500 [Propioniciclava coleopterorum]